MRSSSSSSDSSTRRGKKSKGAKVKGKGAKKSKDKKKSKKEKRKAEKAEAWDYDRADTVRLLGQLLEINAGVADELKAVFGAVDEGETVHIDGLEDKRVKKKLRHLLQGLRLTPAEGQGFRTPDRGMSFTALFRSCLREARARAAPEAGAAPTAVGAPTAALPAAVVDVDLEPEDRPAAGGGAAPRVRGPQLPTPGVALATADASSDEGEGGGPRPEGEERRGVDLDSVPAHTRREAWMTQPHESIAAAFQGDASSRPAKAERFEVKRTREEQEQFEGMMKARGPSLLQQTMEGDFQGCREAAEHTQKQAKGAQDVWGVSVREQGRPAAGGSRERFFDPEQDLQVRRPMSREGFSKLVENSVSGLADRFGRGNVATSFL
mmetsp:Transcript_9219/g.25776  ORF Transcript_9219/g.25776 Transcript_9219/m.25776 type:complete len:379 (-) Transcript_9219:31-1167(-)